jgi:hypothetical protein
MRSSWADVAPSPRAVHSGDRERSVYHDSLIMGLFFALLAALLARFLLILLRRSRLRVSSYPQASTISDATSGQSSAVGDGTEEDLDRT